MVSTNAIESSNEYGALVVLYQNLYEAYDLMTTMVQNIGVPGEIAKQLTIDTMWDAWEYLCNYVSEDLTTLIQNALNNNSVDGVVQRIGETTDASGTSTTGTIMGKLNYLIGVSGIKSVQRGTSTSTSVIAISTVDPQKCLVLINGVTYSGSIAVYQYYLSSITSTSITVLVGGGSGTFSWQVIEFY